MKDFNNFNKKYYLLIHLVLLENTFLLNRANPKVLGIPDQRIANGSRYPAPKELQGNFKKANVIKEKKKGISDLFQW